MDFQQARKKYDWTLEELGFPKEIDGHYYLTVKTNSNGFKNQEELDKIRKEAAKIGIEYLTEFYRKESNEQAVQRAVEVSIHEEWFLDARPNSFIKVLVVTPIDEFNKIFPISTPNPLVFKTDIEIKLPLREITQLIDLILSKIRQARSAVNSWTGNITGFNPTSFEKRLKEFNAAVQQLLVTNGFTQDGDFSLHVDKNYNVKHTTVDSGEDIVRLTKGFVAFLKLTPIKDTRTLSIIDKVSQNIETFLDPETTWVDILTQYIYPAIPIKPSLTEPLSTIRKGVDQIINTALPPALRKTALSGVEKLQEDAKLTSNFKLNARDRRERETDYVGDQFLVDIEVIPPRLSELEDCFNEMLHKISLGQLMNMAMSCIPSFDLGFDIDLDFKLPELDFPTVNLPQLPTIDFLAFIRINLEDILKSVIKEILQYLINMLIEMFMKFCENDANYGGKNGAPGGANINDALEIDITNVPKLYGDMVVEEDAPDNLDDLLKDFVDDVSDSLTPGQLCALLTGNITSLIFETIRDILKKEKYAPLREFFSNSDNIENFFKNIGDILGNVRVEELCASDLTVSNPCDVQASIEALLLNLYELKDLRGESIPEEFAEEQIRRSRELNEALVGVINDIAAGDITELFNEDLFSTLGNTSPFDNKPDDVELVSDIVVDGTFAPLELRIEDIVKKYFRKVVNNITEISNQIIGEKNRDPLEEYKTIFENIARNVPDVTIRTLANTIVNSPFFSAIGFITNLNTFFNDPNTDILKMLGIELLKEDVKRSVTGVTFTSFSQNTEFPPFEAAFAEDLYKAYVRIVILDKLFQTYVITTIFDSDQLFKAENKYTQSIVSEVEKAFSTDVNDILQKLIKMDTASFVLEQRPRVIGIVRDSIDFQGISPRLVADVYSEQITTVEEGRDFLTKLGTISDTASFNFERIFSTEEDEISQFFNEVKSIFIANIEAITGNLK